MNKGIFYAISAYLLWGIFPIYWKLINHVPAIEIIGHRIAWSFIFVILIIYFSGKWPSFLASVQNRKNLLPYLISAILLGVNWFVYVWAVNSGYIIETSLGYFINPLVSVLLGVIFLKEKLRVWQWFSVFLAGLGICFLSWRYGSLPWIGLTLAFSFAIYAFIKKKAALNSIQGFTVETGIMVLPAIVYLSVIEKSGRGALGNQAFWVICLLLFAGVATGLPLLLFGAAARRINLSTLGFLQYIAPTLQFMIGVFVYNEAFSQERLVGFGMIWLALLLFSIEAVVSQKRRLIGAPAD
jgi:chloramphenicol-sensitive protein RarD